MKFARSLQESEQPELHALYKQLKKSLRILDDPADAGSIVLPPQLPCSSSDDELEDVPVAAGTGNTAAADVQQPQQQGQQPQGQQQGQQQQGQEDEQEGGQEPRRPDSEQEARFVALVEQCVQQLNEDYLSREEMLVIKADLAQSAAATAGSHGELLASYGSVVNLHGELVLLCHWSMMAYTGIVKILKKHYKHTGQRVQSAPLANLLAQPFCSLEEVRGMVRAAEQQIALLASRLGLAPSVAPTAGAAAAAAVRYPASEQQPVEALLGGESPPMGESGPRLAAPAAAPATAAAGAAAVAAAAAGGRQQQPGQAGGQQALAVALAPREQQVPLVAASGSGRAVLKRDRSKRYFSMNKRHEPLGGPDGPREAQPQSSGSSMQASQDGDLSLQQEQQQQQQKRTSSGTPTGGSPMGHSPAGSSPTGGSPAAGSGFGSGGVGGVPRRTSIMQRTRAALQLWKSLRSNASTPSTVLGQPTQQQPSPPR